MNGVLYVTLVHPEWSKNATIYQINTRAIKPVFMLAEWESRDLHATAFPVESRSARPFIHQAVRAQARPYRPVECAMGRALRQRMAQELGAVVEVGAVSIPAFPAPQVVRELASFKGISTEKIERLHSIAQAALDGLLDRTVLRSIPSAQATAYLRTLPGIGPFFAPGILFRGAGVVDDVTDDDVTKQAVQRAYQLPQLPTHQTVLRLAEPWRPYRMWATVLLHICLRREAGGPQRQGKRVKKPPPEAEATSAGRR